MKNGPRLSAWLLSAALAVSPAAAGIGVNVDVLWNPNPKDDSQVFLHLSNVAYPAPRVDVMEIFHEISNPYETYPTLAFIAHYGHVSIETVWGYKKKGHEWYNVMMHFGVQPNVLFFEVPQQPARPYGKAYGYWKKHGNKLKPDMISNDDVRYWVSLRTVTMASGVTPGEAVKWHQSGKRFEQLAGTKYREKHGSGPELQEAGFGPGKGKGKGKGGN